MLKLFNYSILNLVLILSLFSSWSFDLYSYNFISYPKGNEYIGVLADVEGNWDKFVDYVKNGDTLYFDDNGVVHLRPNRTFVFLGDVVGRGPGAIRIVEAMMRVVENNPDRAIIILGNHDIMKMRLIAELSDRAMETVPLGMKLWLMELMTKNQKNRPITEAIYFKLLPQYNTRANRLRWILSQTMAEPNAFDFKRQELRILYGRKNITDEEVIESYLDAMRPDGFFERYLSLGRIAAIVGRTLFIHGAVNKTNYGYIPGRTDRILELPSWVNELNLWKGRELAAWKNDRFALLEEPGGSQLLLYQGPINGTGRNDHSVMFSVSVDETGNLVHPEKEVIQYLKPYVDRVVAGHYAIGDIPVATYEGGLEIIYADGSDVKSNRSTKILFNDQETILEALLSNLNRFSCRVQLNDPDRIIGRRTQDGHIILGNIENGDFFTRKFYRMGGTPSRRHKIISPSACNQLFMGNL